MPARKEAIDRKVGRRDLLLLLIGVEPSGADAALGGITRIQKLLFLLSDEEGIHPLGDGFEFEPYKAGPYSARIYDDLELLENLDYIQRVSPTEPLDVCPQDDDVPVDELEQPVEASEPEKAEVDLTYDQLMGPEDVMAPGSDEPSPTSDSYEELRYALTPKGKKKVEELLANPECKPIVAGIRRVKSRFSKYSLNDLLYYVYTRYPEMTTESEIKEKVLRRRPA